MYKRLRLLDLGEDLKSKRDPISRYNLVIEQYNDPVNRNQEILLNKAHNNTLYVLWYSLQCRCLFILLLLYFIPYVSLLTLLLNLITFIVHSFALRTYSSNKKRIKDPLANMIYDTILCKRGSADFLYFEINPENIESFKFDKPTVERLVSKSIQSYDGKIRFMAYNNRFLAGLHNLSNAGYIAFIHLFLNMMIFYVIQYYVYERVLGLKLFEP